MKKNGSAKMNRFDVFTINLDSTKGSEIKKTRPCVIISPDEMNRCLKTVIIAPMTTSKKNYASRVNIKFQSKNNQVVLDQIRTVDKGRLLKRIGKISTADAREISSLLIEMFTY